MAAHRPCWCQRGTRRRPRAPKDGAARCSPDGDSNMGGSVLTVYFGTPNMFITLWFGFDYGTNPPLGTLLI
jgi:hypothetical protein